MQLDRVLIADDHPLFRGAMSQALKAWAPSAQVMEAGSMDSLQDMMADAEELDLLMLDLHIPGADGFSALVYVRARHPDVPVIMVSANEDATVISQAKSHGAAGFVPKSASMDEIGRVVDRVLAGETSFPDWADSSDAGDPSEVLSKMATLTPQQRRVLRMVGKGLLNKQIAYDLNVSEATIKAHLTAIMRKLGVRNRTQAVALVNQLTIAPGFGGDGDHAEANGT
ncbi:MAG: response regulator transcription factor [Pseudomonadota bacterium]